MCPNGLAGGCELNLLCAKLGLKCGENRNFQAATKLKGRQGQNFCSSTGSISKLAARCKIARDVVSCSSLSHSLYFCKTNCYKLESQNWVNLHSKLGHC